MKQKYNENGQSKWLKGLRRDKQSAKMNIFNCEPAALPASFIDHGSIKPLGLAIAIDPFIDFYEKELCKG